MNEQQKTNTIKDYIRSDIGICPVCNSEFKRKFPKQGGGTTQIYCSHNCISRRWSKNNKDKSKAIKQKYADKPSSKLKKSIYAKEQKQWLRYTPEFKLLCHARKRASDKKLEFSLTVLDIKIPKICPLLGIDLIPAKGKVTPNSPSIDRLDSTKGYTPDNIWVISFKANTAKSNLSLSELKILTKKLEERLTEKAINDSGR